MLGKAISAALIFSLLIANSVNAQSNSCSLPTPNILVSEGASHLPDSRLFQYWDIPDRAGLWAETGQTSSAYRRYIRKVRAMNVNTDPVVALTAYPGVNNYLVKASAPQWIRPSNCLEKLLMGLQDSRVSILQAPTEFVSVVLKKPATNQLRIYFYSVNRNGIGAMTPITRRVDQDVADGWALKFVLHNHAFSATDAALNGILAPSNPDANFNVNFARSHGLPEARITNGLNTVVLPATSFDKFQTE
jgi:hypothetical protein